MEEQSMPRNLPTPLHHQLHHRLEVILRRLQVSRVDVVILECGKEELADAALVAVGPEHHDRQLQLRHQRFRRLRAMI